MMTIAEIEEEIREEFAMFDDWEDRYNYLIDLGKDLPLIDPGKKTDERIIKGCQSRVWLDANATDEGKIIYTADSDAIITKGLISLMVRVLSNQPAIDIAQTELSFIDDIGLKEHLSPTRSNGLVSMINQMKRYAIQYLASKV
jgi:cysteine desulfuration protein SufE